MWNLPKGSEFLPKMPLKRLERLYQSENDARAKTRLLAAIHRKEGKSVDKIAALMHQKKPTVYDWITKFNERGIDAKTDPKRPGKPSLLTDAQRKDLIKRLEKGPLHNPGGLWASKDVRLLIQKQYGVSYVPQHIWRILVSAGFTLQIPRKRHHKSASKSEIKVFKKTPNGKHNATERKVLLWPQKTKRHSA